MNSHVKNWAPRLFPWYVRRGQLVNSRHGAMLHTLLQIVLHNIVLQGYVPMVAKAHFKNILLGLIQIVAPRCVRIKVPESE